MKLLLFITGIFIFYSTAYSQHQNESKYPADGMVRKVYNLSSFKSRSVKNLESWKKWNNATYWDHPEFGILVDEAPCENCVEDLSKRSIDERYFVDLDDTTKFYQQKALGNLNEERNGWWQTIRHELSPIQNGIAASNYLENRVSIDFNSFKTKMETQLGALEFNNWKLKVLRAGGLYEYYSPNWENYSVGEDGALITNFFPGIDAEIVVQRGSIKTSFIINTNEFGVFDQLLFQEELSGITGVHAEFEDFSSNQSQGVGNLKIMSGSTELATMFEGKLFARNGPKSLARSAVYRINGNSIDLLVDFDWINDNISSHQLIVDPLVTGTATLAQASITGSRYNGSCNFTNSCDYNLTVASPANATLNNASFSFTYSANGTTCWLEDGATRIAVGSCVSPSATGFYWFCNAVGGGNCAATNQSIFSDVASCLPAPSCTPQNIVFTLKFYRSCWGATGCSNTCIGAASPWTMTITGNTIAYTNTTTPITLSATTVCQGQSVTASTSGTTGVPGYTYNWSFSPTGTPSLASTATANIIFPTAGSITLYSFVTDACGNQVTASRVITVTPGPTISATPNPLTICSGQATSIALTSGTAGTTFGWTVTQTGVSGGSNGTGSSIAQTLSTTGTVAGTAVYTVLGTAAGCVSNPLTVTVNVNPLPVITVNSPTICVGQSATLTASGAASYTWTPTATLSSGTGSTVTATPTTTTNYTVTGTSLGCTSSATATVTIIPNPVITVAGGTICNGQNITLNASGATTYTWTPSATLSSGTGTSVVASPTATTTYTIVGTTGSCSSSTTATVTVNPLPVVTVNSPTICAGQSATLNASGATSYSWSPATDLSATTGASVTATPSSTVTYVVTGTTNGCSNTANAVVSVNPNPVVSVSPITICAGSSGTLTASGATSYSWSPGATLSSTTGSTVTANPASTTTYTVIGTTNSCTGTATVTVTVTPLPVVTVNNTAICVGQSATLTASGATGYTWTADPTLASTTGATVTATPTTTTTYTVTGNANGCSSTATGTVTVNSLPTVTVNSPTICLGQSANLTASGANTYTWNASSDLSGTNGANQTATPAATTSYTVTGTDANGCINSASSTVTVNPLPTVSASNNGPICAGQTAQLTANSPSATSYTWSGPVGFSSNSATPSIASVQLNQGGTYTVTATALGCSSTASTVLVVNPAISTVITPVSPLCSNANVVNLIGATSGGTWSGTGIVSPSTGSFDPTIAGVGTHTITYTISGNCGSSSTTQIQVLPIPVQSISSTATSGCVPLLVTLSDFSTPASINSVWSLSDGNTGTGTSYSPTLNGSGCIDITLTSTTANGCVNTTVFPSFICTALPPIASITVSPAEAPVADPTFQFINSSSNEDNVVWDFGDGSTSNVTSPVHTYAGATGSYLVELIAYSSIGCSDTAYTVVTVKEDILFFVPNAFTPNGDEHNNSFKPVFTAGVDPYNFNFTIFNRWGEVIFESNNPDFEWDGTYHEEVVPSGAYTWTCRFKSPTNDSKFQYHGHLNVLR